MSQTAIVHFATRACRTISCSASSGSCVCTQSPLKAACTYSVRRSVNDMRSVLSVIGRRVARCKTPRASYRPLPGDESRLMLDVLFGRCGEVEFAGLTVGGCDSQGLLQVLARTEAVGPGVTFGLHAGLALCRDDDFDNTGHQGSSREAS